jgi:hypothetical protein
MQQPGSISNIVPPASFQDWARREIDDLKREIRALHGARRLENAIIGKGGISIKGGALKLLDAITGAVLVVLDSLGLHIKAGGTINVDQGGTVELNDGSSLHVNDGGAAIMSTPADHIIFQLQRIAIPDGSGRNQQVFALGRDDGTIAFALADLGTVLDHPHQQNWAFYDRGANIVFADDTDSGQGIARPYIPLGAFMPNTYPTETTTSSSFVTLQTLVGFKQQPKVVMQVLVRADDPSTDGEIRVIDQDGNVIGGVQTVSAGAFGYINIGPAALPGAHELAISLNIQARRTSGTGTIGIRGISAWGQAT